MMKKKGEKILSINKTLKNYLLVNQFLDENLIKNKGSVFALSLDSWLPRVMCEKIISGKFERYEIL